MNKELKNCRVEFRMSPALQTVLDSVVTFRNQLQHHLHYPLLTRSQVIRDLIRSAAADIPKPKRQYNRKAH